MLKKEVFYWGMYDLANTIFSALFVTFFFPFYVKTFLGGNEFQIGLVFGLSMLLVAILVPIIGAWSDNLGRRMPFIIIFTVICCLLTLLVSYTTLALALIAGFFANFSYHAALTTYNALLPKIAGKYDLGKISGIGIGMGYIGTLISLAIAAIILSRLGWETIEGSKAMFVLTAILFFTLSLFTFFGIKEKKKIETKGFFSALENVKKTIVQAKKHKTFFRFLLAMFFYANAIFAIIVFLFLYARTQLNLSVQAFFAVYLIQSVGAVIGSLIAGKYVDKYNSKTVLWYSGVLWVIVVAALMLFTNLVVFIIAGTIGGAALGAVWTAQRPKLLELVPKKNVGQFFGFLELTNKFSGVFGPIVFGWLAKYYSYQAGMASVILFFAIGLIMLRD
ncbi:hypothetical protein COV18_02945 [Candidatus Woesearchaeota archaeon CG10_big_fil_rev_8_21_14_0_10_37_12]|nr:MAG: hypothetical protein COV18_02945 [Candidatus Woesearchaeota archaeon CG10_big_fil_rev_8_21_14_0_10_37_12]